jgi:hypothetical protein
MAVGKHLIEHFPSINFVNDKPIFLGRDCDCPNYRRLDFHVLIGNTILGIEVDENRHGTYDNEDQEIRYDDVLMHAGTKFVYLRFFPGFFRKVDNKGYRIINPLFYRRLEQLTEAVEAATRRIKNEENMGLVEIKYVCYELDSALFKC